MEKLSRKRRAEIDAELRRRVKERAERPAKETLPLWPEKVEAGALVRKLDHYVRSLRAEDAHGNRSLFLDDVFVAYLLAFFNPTMRSLRAIEDFSETRQSQRYQAIKRIPKSTLSDFNRIADPQRMETIIAELRGALQRKYPNSSPKDEGLGVLKKIIAVDGTYLSALADVAWAVGLRNQHKKKYRARLDVHVDTAAWVPEHIAVPEPGEGEAARAAKAVQRDAIHVYDRAYGSFELLLAHYQSEGETLRATSEFVLRAKKNQLLLNVTEEREPTAEQRAQGVVSDRIGYFQGSPGHHVPPFPVREVILVGEDGEQIRLLSNLLDLGVEIIGLLYRQRWQIELFFRWLKCYANFDHLISHQKEGVLLHFYVAMVGAILMYLHTGFRPSKYAFNLLGMLAQGGVDTLESILPILRERERQCERDRQSAARRRAKKNG
ncbi:MAG: IS4 family transposase [Pirellulales bacterium]